MDDKAFEMLEADVREIKQDVKSLMMFMAVEKAKAKKNTMITSGLISLIVSLISLAVGKIL
jgi:hypothetical protein